MTQSAQRLSVFTLLFRADGRKGPFHVSYEVVAEDAEEAARLALNDFAKRGEKPIDVERADAHPLGNPFTPKGVTMRVGCAFAMRAA